MTLNVFDLSGRQFNHFKNKWAELNKEKLEIKELQKDLEVRQQSLTREMEMVLRENEANPQFTSLYSDVPDVPEVPAQGELDIPEKQPGQHTGVNIKIAKRNEGPLGFNLARLYRAKYNIHMSVAARGAEVSPTSWGRIEKGDPTITTKTREKVLNYIRQQAPELYEAASVTKEEGMFN